MADERYQWLDPEAAERLLRGEPVDPADPSARVRAAALADALDAARTAAVPAPGVPLAGEEAALAAFRTATAARAAAPAAASAAPAAPADLGRVRLTSAPGPARRWGRSLRYGLAAALAAVTVGGVAVAAGTGVLPLVDKEPSRTVTAAETATPTDPGEPTSGIERHPDPSWSADPGRTDGTPAPGASPTARPDGHATTSPRPGVTPSGENRPDRGRTAPTPTGRVGDSREGRLTACREYRSGRLDTAGRERLADALRVGETLRLYCDKLLAGTGEGDAAGTGDGDGDGDRDKDKDTGDGDAKDEDGNAPDLSHGTVPTPADSSRKRGQGRPDPKDRPRAKAKTGTGPRTGAPAPAGDARETVPGTPAGALALCPV
ncbi:hypothetical protein ACFVU3_35290 [Streptomyces sp. NPDC058052]|uniref:hypothetical protein n=1 Tax=Streptomyces sp. NPDC058052 TaxID=3346316 RepID=UPI0036E67AE7